MPSASSLSSPKGDHKDRPYTRDTGNCKPLYFFDSTILPPFCVHSSALVSTQPCPLQEFCPAQECSAVAQLAFPLHSLMPAQCTISSPALSVARATRLPLVIRLATALAIMIPLPNAFIVVPPGRVCDNFALL